MALQVQQSGNLVKITNTETGDDDFPTSLECHFQNSGDNIWIYSEFKRYAARWDEILDESGQPKGSKQETLDYLSTLLG